MAQGTETLSNTEEGGKLRGQNLKEISEKLTALEMRAIALITARTPMPLDRAELTESCAEMKRAEEEGGRVLWSEADDRFHRGLLICSGNTHMKNLGLRYRDRIRRTIGRYANRLRRVVQPLPGLPRGNDTTAAFQSPVRRCGNASAPARQHRPINPRVPGALGA